MDVIYRSSAVNQTSTFDETQENFLRSIFVNGYFPVVKFALKNYNPRYRNGKPRSPKEVSNSVLESDRVQWISRVIAREEETTLDSVLSEASKILNEMAYADHMSLTRSFGFALFHVLSKLYQEGVFIGKQHFGEMQDALQKYPVVFMPSHRSYMDFLILSLVCYYLNIPLPAIASGMDFMKMTGVSTLLRSAGAFFMRRSFGSDKLYWAVFSEYVHTILTNCDKPIEFFIEGTRSRTGKSLQPKLGLFNIVAEPYIKAQTYDVMIVPVSISYGRVLEEQLYAYELLGVPKPKESTTGLMKAVGVLKENYGSLHINFGKTISVRETCSTLQRSKHACYPRYMLRLSQNEQDHLRRLSYKVLLQQQANMVIHVWVVACVFLAQVEDGLSISNICNKVDWLLDVLRRWEVKLFVPSGSLSDVLHQIFLRHKYLINIASEEDKGDYVSINEFPSQQENAAVRLMIGNYRNQVMHVLSHPFLVLYAEELFRRHPQHSVRQNFVFLRSVLSNEFVFEPGQEESDFDLGTNRLAQCGIVRIHDNAKAAHMFDVLYKCYRPFLFCYILVCEYLVQFHHGEELKTLSLKIQRWLKDIIRSNDDEFGDELLEVLSLNIISNGLSMLKDHSALIMHKTESKTEVFIRRGDVYVIGNKLKNMLCESLESTVLNHMLLIPPIAANKL